MDDGLIRQRRNLMIISMILLFVSFAGVSISHEISLLGMIFHIDKPIMVYLTIWIMFIYFFIRFFQYYLDIDDAKKDYWFDNMFYPWGGFVQEHRASLNFWRILFNAIAFIFSNVLQIIQYFIHILFNKNFSDNFLPILFSLIVGVLSWNTEFTISKREILYKIYETEYNKISNEIKNKIDSFTYSKNIDFR